MAFKIVVLLAALAYANAGIVAPVAHYSPAAAVSSSYIHQAAAPVATYAHAGPVAHYAQAAPVAHYAQAAPVAHYAQAAPVAHYAQVAPVATYAHAAPVATYAHTGYAPHIGATSQSVVRSLGGDQAVSHYSKAVDSAFSSVRKYDTRITNDGLAYAHTPVATYAHAAPVAHYAHAAPVAHYAQAAHYAHAAPVTTYSHSAPVTTYAQAAPVAHYAQAAHYAHAAPVVTKTAIAYSPATVVSHASFEGLGTHYQW